ASLPAGLSFNTTTGVISGTPTTITTTAQYIVTVNLQGGSTAADTLQIAVVAGQTPGAPSNVTATAGNAQATVTWNAPATTGSGTITGYTVKAVSDASKTCTWTSGPLSCVVTGHTNGTPYTFTVTASNGEGAGAASAPSAAVTPAGLPGSPSNIVVAQTSGAGASPAVSVSWTPATSNGGSEIFS